MGLLLQAWCAHAVAESIYTCIDSKGRRLTADRPIAECVDREQKELHPSGSLKRRVAPTLTAEERFAEEDRVRKVQQELHQVGEEKRRDRALLIRYPNKPVHDKERVAAMTSIDDVIATAAYRVNDLTAQRKTLDMELEFFKADPAKVPGRLRRQLEENDQNQAAQKRFMTDQSSEKQRVNSRFDEELVRLQQLWNQPGRPQTVALPVAPNK